MQIRFLLLWQISNFVDQINTRLPDSFFGHQMLIRFQISRLANQQIKHATDQRIAKSTRSANFGKQINKVPNEPDEPDLTFLPKRMRHSPD